MTMTDHAGKELTPDEAACYLAASLVMRELKTRGGVMAHQFPHTDDEIALRVALSKLHGELMHRAGQPGYALA